MTKQIFAPFSYSSRLLTSAQVEKLEKSIRTWVEFLTQAEVEPPKEVKKDYVTN